MAQREAMPLSFALGRLYSGGMDRIGSASLHLLPRHCLDSQSGSAILIPHVNKGACSQYRLGRVLSRRTGGGQVAR